MTPSRRLHREQQRPTVRHDATDRDLPPVKWAALRRDAEPPLSVWHLRTTATRGPWHTTAEWSIIASDALHAECLAGASHDALVVGAAVHICTEFTHRCGDASPPRTALKTGGPAPLVYLTAWMRVYRKRERE